ncbi:MAG: septum formation initiator family protein [Patescibacteria group bacterium]|nr:septum formation initiator family protein [Patescibacteria group bacterium]
MIQKTKRIKKENSCQTIFSTLIGCLLVIIIGFLIFSNLKISQKRSELIAQIETLKKEIQILEEKNQRLKEKISQARTESYLEKVAREQLDLKKPGEEVVVIKKEKGKETKEEKSFWQRLLEKLKI